MIAAGARGGSTSVEETRTRILGAARELFERNGTRGTTTREVAERAGVNEATLFRHFGSKRHLLDAMREQASDPEALRITLAGLSGEDVRADLRQLATVCIDHMVAKRGMICVSLAEDSLDTGDSPEWRGPTRTVNSIAGYFERGVASGRLQCNPMIAAQMFLSLFFAYVVANKLWATQDPATDTIGAIVDHFLNGVTP